MEVRMRSKVTMAEGSEGALADEETLKFKAVWKKNTYEITFPASGKVLKLKEHIQSLTGIPALMMKLMYKGILKDDDSLEEAKIVSGIKIMVVGTTLEGLLSVQQPDPSELKKSATEEAESQREKLSESKEHKKIIEKGKPDGVTEGFKGRKEPLPPNYLGGLLNKYGAKVRLYFKLELDQLWIGTNERTDKIPLGSIRNVMSEPILGHEDYHIMALQLGPTENSRYWLYWVPAQYVEAIKDTILGKWQYF